NGINHAPASFHHIGALEESLIAHDAVVEKNLVAGVWSAAEIIGVVEIHLHRTNPHLGAGHLGPKAHGDTFIRSDVHYKLIWFQAAYGSVAKKNKWSALELDGNFGMAVGQ